MTVLFAARRPAPRLVVKILGFTFAVITVILATVFMMLSWQTRGRLQRAIVANVESSQQRFAELEAHLQAGQRLQAATLADRSSDLSTLFKAWGLDYARDRIVLDRAHALQISIAPNAPPVRHPAILGFTRMHTGIDGKAGLWIDTDPDAAAGCRQHDVARGRSDIANIDTAPTRVGAEPTEHAGHPDAATRRVEAQIPTPAVG